MKKLIILCILAVISMQTVFANEAVEGNAQKFGIYEVVLTGNGSVSNPFDTIAQVTFTPPSGKQRTVYAFYDGDNIWRARAYTDEVGEWKWASVSQDDLLLNGKQGAFNVVDSTLPGKLTKHPKDSKALATDNGKWFLNISDTAYYLFHDDSTQWKEFVEDDWKLGVNSLRANLVGNLRQADKQHNPDGWDRVFADTNNNTFKLESFRTTDTRLKWMLENYPDMYVQMIITPEPSTWTKDEVFWRYLSDTQKERYLRYVVARYAAYPQIFWLITNDAGYSSSNPYNVALANEVGNYLLENDPWADKNLRSTGRNRDAAFYFTDAKWASYIHIETKTALAADQAAKYISAPMHVYNGEDWYEGEKSITNDSYFFRRLFWSWTLSGGSATYGGYWRDIVAYRNTNFTGLDDIIHMKNFFADNNITLDGFTRDNEIVTGPTGAKKVVLMKNANNSRFVLYHPNAASDGGTASVATDTATFTITDLPQGDYTMLWAKADDGTSYFEAFTHQGGSKTFTAPWKGVDAAAYIKKTDLSKTGLSINSFEILSGDNPISYVNRQTDTTLQGKASICNPTDTPQNVIVLIAHYSDGKLIECQLSDSIEVPANNSKNIDLLTNELSTNKMLSGDIVKLFIWDTGKSMISHLKPLNIAVEN